MSIQQAQPRGERLAEDALLVRRLEVADLADHAHPRGAHAARFEPRGHTLGDVGRQISHTIAANPGAGSAYASFTEAELASLLDGTSVSAEDFRTLVDSLK